MRERIAQLKEQISGLTEQIDAKDQEIALIEEELKGVLELWKKQLVPLTRVTALKRDAARIGGERGQLIASKAKAKAKSPRSSCRSSRSTRICAARSPRSCARPDKIGELIERKIAAEDQLKRIDIRAPQDGTVLQSTVHTVGGVITAGDTIMMIVPAGRPPVGGGQGQSAGHRQGAGRAECDVAFSPRSITARPRN